MKKNELFMSLVCADINNRKLYVTSYTAKMAKQMGHPAATLLAQYKAIRFVSSLLDTAVERFGRYNVSYSRSDDHHFNVSADVEISDQFFGWLCGFGTKAKLFSPNSVVEQYKEYLQKILSKY